MTDSDNSGGGGLAFIVTGGPLDGQQIDVLTGVEAVLGSSPNSALPFDLANVAAEHAQVTWGAAGALLSDLASTTGTYVNGERVAADHPLRDGDRVCLGPPGSKQSVKLLVRLPEGLDELDSPTLDLRGAAAQFASSANLELSGPLEDAPLVLVAPRTQAEAEPPRRGDAIGITATASDELDVTGPAPAEELPEAAPKAEDTGARRAVKPDYTSEMPSIGGDRPREPLAVPARTTPASRPAVARPNAPRGPSASAATLRLAALGVAGLVVVALVGFGLKRWLTPVPVVELATTVVEPGAQLVIDGSGFAPDAGDNEVLFGKLAATVTGATADRLTVTVPALDVSRGAFDVELTVTARGKRSAPVNVRARGLPGIAKLEPDVALAGEEVKLILTAPPDGEVTVLIDGQSAELVGREGSTLRVKVPQVNAPVGRNLPVLVMSGKDSSATVRLMVGHLPLLLSAEPATAALGTQIKLKGRGFSSDLSGNAVAFDGRTALVLAAKADELQVVVPACSSMDTQAQAGVVVTVAGSPSNTLAFTVARSSSLAFVPRFFAEPEAGSNNVWISTELGPVLSLTEPDGAPSVGHRAVRVAEALNTQVDAGLAGRPAGFELRDNPRPGVGASGAELVGVTAGEAAAYQLRGKGSVVSPRSLAAHWTALLQDYFTLFVAYRRPLAMAELSPRGRVLIDLYATAQQRTAGGGTGVPRSILLPASREQAQRLLDLALLLPTAKEKPAAGVALEGAWEGSYSEATGERGVRVTIQRSGAKLTGSLATSSRVVSMGIPLSNLSYEKGTVKFTAIVGGAPREFVGQLSAGTITGVVQSPGGKQQLGQFSLKFVR